MKIILFLICILVVSQPFYNAKDCSDAYSAADDAYSYSKKAYYADDLDDIKYYAKKAMSSFDDAMLYAEDCGCDDAYSSADDGYSNAKKAYNSDNVSDGQYYARKAKGDADDTMSYADDCSD